MSVKERVGKVVSDKMQKTITVLVETRVQHPRYKKFVFHRKKLYAHDERGEAHLGDLVKIQETRPLSKMKRWRLIEVVQRNPKAAHEGEAA
jgi:small subunit ribosomal protein S17